jgi:SsrA-binding protein
LSGHRLSAKQILYFEDKEKRARPQPTGYSKTTTSHFNGKAILHNCHIGTYSHGNQMNHEPLCPRTLLLNKKEIERLMAKVQKKGLTLVPLRLYFNEKGRVKVELSLARGKKTYDRRETIKKREAGREIDRAMKESRS